MVLLTYHKYNAYKKKKNQTKKQQTNKQTNKQNKTKNKQPKQKTKTKSPQNMAVKTATDFSMFLWTTNRY